MAKFTATPEEIGKTVRLVKTFFPAVDLTPIENAMGKVEVTGDIRIKELNPPNGEDPLDLELCLAKDAV